MSITIYSKPNCPHCNRAKKLLSDNNQEYTELTIGKDVDRLTVLEKFPGVKLVPIIVVGPHHLDGIEELELLIQNDQLKDLI